MCEHLHTYQTKKTLWSVFWTRAERGPLNALPVMLYTPIQSLNAHLGYYLSEVVHMSALPNKVADMCQPVQFLQQHTGSAFEMV